MLSRPGPLPCGTGWSFELKWDGFRALVSTEDGLRVRSRRGWNMTEVLPELRGLPPGLVFDGETRGLEEEPALLPTHLPTRAQSGHVSADDLRHLRRLAARR